MPTIDTLIKYGLVQCDLRSLAVWWIQLDHAVLALGRISVWRRSAAGRYCASVFIRFAKSRTPYPENFNRKARSVGDVKPEGSVLLCGAVD